MAAIMLMLDDDENRRQIRRERIFRDRTQVLDTLTSDVEFIERYRFPRGVILRIVDSVEVLIQPATGRSHSIPTHIQVFTCLRFLAKGDYLSEVADTHGISKSSACVIVHRVINAICATLDNIHFPTRTEDIKKIKADFYSIAGFPNVVGAIDGTHIPIQGMSSEEEPLYICRKGYHSINVQAVVDPDLRFTNVVCKFPGSTHDAFILQSSSLPECVANLDDEGWLIGDSGYPLKEWLMTPVNNPRTAQEKPYNSSHCKTRNVIERAFGVLKARFRCPHKTGGSLPYKPGKCTKIIECAMRLHNLAIDLKVPLMEAVELHDVDNDQDFAPTFENMTTAALRERIIQRF